MKKTMHFLGICGSASTNSSNLAILKHLAETGTRTITLDIINDLSTLPHFRTELTDNNTPTEIRDFRKKIAQADGVIICTPEYVFSIPSGLKNALEWCVSTTIFANKPVALITASANGIKGHEELKLIMKTIQATFNEDTCLLIQGVKGKTTKDGQITDEDLKLKLAKVASSLQLLATVTKPDK